MKPMDENGDSGAGEDCALNDLPDIAALPDDVRQDLTGICRKRVYVAGTTIIEAGVPAAFVGIVGSGILGMRKTLPDGRQHIVGLLVAGDLFGRVFNSTLHFSIEAATNAEVFMFQRAAFEEILQRSTELDRLVLLNLARALDRARDWMIILANPKIRQRLAGFVLMICTRFQSVDELITPAEGAIRVRIPISRPDLASLLGTRVESISRALHALADDGLIDILRPDLVEIRRIDALLDEFGEPDLFDPAALHRLTQSDQTPSD